MCDAAPSTEFVPYGTTLRLRLRTRLRARTCAQKVTALRDAKRERVLHSFYTAVRYERVSGGTDRDVKCAYALLSGTARDAMG